MSNTSMKGDEAFAKRKQGVQKNELNEQLKDYINQWRDERSKEEAELKRLKDKQAARKEIRAEQEKKQAEQRRRRSRGRSRKRRKQRPRPRRSRWRRMRGKGKRCSPPRRREARSPLVPPWTLAKRCPS